MAHYQVGCKATNCRCGRNFLAGIFYGDNKDRLLNQAMLLLAAQPNAFFLGQNVAYDGNVVFRHLAGIPMAQRLELPVCEDLQMGMSIGLALQGFLPISIYPRMDFLVLALNQLINHLDKLPAMSLNQYRPKVIIRTKVGSRYPLDAGPQHTQDHTEAFRLMLTTVAVEKITSAQDVLPAYQRALDRELSSIVIEAMD